MSGGKGWEGRKDAVLVAGTMFASALPFLLAPVRAQLLGPAGRGEFAYFQSSIMIIFAVSALGIRHAVYRAQKQGLERFQYGTLPLLGFSLVVSVACGAVLAAFASNGLSTEVAAVVLVVSLFGPIYAVTQLEVANAQLSHHRKRIGVLAGAPAVLEFVVSVVLVVVRQLNVATAIATTLFAELVRNIASVSWRAADRRRADLTSRTQSRWDTGLLRTSIIAAPAVAVPVLASNLDMIIYGALVGSTPLGMYAVAKLGFTVMVLTALTLEGRIVRRLAHTGPRRSAIVIVGLALPLAAFVALGGVALFPLAFGSAYEEARVAFPIAAAAGVFGAVFVSFLAISAYNERQRAALLAAVVSLATLAVGAVLVSALGVATASTMCSVLLIAQIVGATQATLTMSRREGTDDLAAK